MKKKVHEFPEGQVQTHILSSGQENEAPVGDKPTDVRTEEMTKVTPAQTMSNSGYERIPTEVFMELKGKELVVVAKYNLESMKREPDMEQLGKDVAHWFNMVQKSLRVLMG